MVPGDNQGLTIGVWKIIALCLTLALSMVRMYYHLVEVVAEGLPVKS